MLLRKLLGYSLSRIYLDMDGVIADFEKAMVDKNLSANELKMKPGSYRELDVYAGAMEGVQMLLRLGFDIHIATKIPNENPLAATEKLLWLQEHFPELVAKTIITPDKGCLGSPGDYLVDDRPHKANADRFCGHFIHFGPEGKVKDWDQLVAKFVAIAKAEEDLYRQANE